MITDISKTLGLDALSEQEQAEFLGQIGSNLLESTLMRFTETLTDEQASALEHYIDSEPDPTVLLSRLSKHYPGFDKIFQEEVESFQSEAKLLLDGFKD